ncbi:hypothetical protein MMPV_008671 [Pyropia vietnamensis]
MSISRMEALGVRGKPWEDQRRFVTLRELPKSAFFSKTAVAAMPNGRGRTVMYSHGEVYKMVEAVASAMRESGVRPGTVCAMLAPNSFDLVVYFMAVQWIGAVAAPIDTSLSKEEVVLALKSTKASIVASPLVDEDERDDNELWCKVEYAARELGLISWHLYRTVNTGVQIEMHGVRASESAAWNGGSADYKVDPDAVAVHLVVTASAPLAVLPLTHRNLAEAAKSFVETYNLVPGQATMVSSPLSTIQGVLTLISAFLSGGLVVLSGDGVFDVTEFWNVAALYEISWLSLDVEDVVALHTETATQIESGSNKHNDVQLAFVRCTGGVVAPELASAMTETLRAPVLCAYGPAEASGNSCTNLLISRRSQSFGKTATNCAVGVFDPETRLPVEAGKAGDIGVAGENVAAGYLDSGEAIASYIIEDNSNEENPKTWFLTGDRGHIDEDGFLYVSGDSRAMRAAELVAIEAEKARLEELERTALEEETRRSGEEYAAAEMARQLADSDNESEAALEEQSATGSDSASESSEVVDDDSEETGSEESDEETETEGTAASESEDEDHAKEAAAAAAAAAATAAAAAAVARDEIGTHSDEDAHKGVIEAEEGTRGLAHRWENQSRDAEVEEVRPAKIEVVQSGLDKEISDTILARMAEIEAGQRRLEVELAARHAHELAELQARLEAAEAEAAAAAEEQRCATEEARSLPAVSNVLMTPQLLSINMEGIEAAVTAAAASAEDSAASTAEAFKAAEAAKKAAESSERASQSSQQAIRAIPPPIPHPAVVVEEVPDSVSRDVSLAAFDAQSVTKVIKVSLDDVEAVMRQHPAVAAVRAFGKADTRYGYDVYCAIVAKKGARLSEAWLKLHAQSMLPATMVPRKFFACSLPSLGAADRVSLATERALQDMNAAAGLSNVKQIKAPQWKPTTAARPATTAQ